MFDPIVLPREFFERLEPLDAAICAQVAAARCPRCGGPLHRSDYPRKPRGGAFADLGATCLRRFSLCCGREGCRRRALPPSVRFLGRRVYLGAVVLVASLVAQRLGAAQQVRRVTAIAARTPRRWLRWWRDAFPATRVFLALAARLVPSVPRALLPASLLARMPGDDLARVRHLLVWLAPLTTGSVPDGARFLRGLG